jgi:2-polyprenyl-3-methyl-5-hydroxy-6-metoxy-1,4-benzoquinol methylase
MLCNYCGCEEYDIIARYTRLERKNVLQCKNCGLVYLEIKKDKREIESFYSSSEYRKDATMPVQSPEEHFYDKVTRHDTENRIQFISNNIDIGDKKILEIGSASGSLLEKLEEYGAKEAIGIELDKEYSKFAQERGLKVFTRSIEELNIKEEFDAVVSFHTLEHVYDPMAVIKAVYVALRPNGCFVGEVPNQNDWRIQIFDNEVIKRFHYDPNHYYYYSPATLKNCLETCGFNKIQLETVERYNSIVQLRNILCKQNSGKIVEEILQKYIFPKDEKDEVRLPDLDNRIEREFNRIFENGVNSELMGNCLRWVAYKILKNGR